MYGISRKISKNARRNMLRKVRTFAANLTKSMNLNHNSLGRSKHLMLGETPAKSHQCGMLVLIIT